MSLTKTQRKKAARLWSDGMTMKFIAYQLGVTWNEMKHEMYWHREAYPRRYTKAVKR